MSTAPALIPVAEAQTRLFALGPSMPIEIVPLAQSVGRWAAEDVVALRTQPAAELSAMDGYAIRFADLPGPFHLIGESAAGRAFAGALGARETARIFTGAPLPDGADSVLVQEEAEALGDEVRLTGEGPRHEGGNVRPYGLDFHRGDVLIAAGVRITPARLALAAIGGHATLPVRRRVVVAVAGTGDELVRPGMPLRDDQLPESNGAMLAAMLADWPVEVVDLGTLPDRLDTLRDAFAAVRADILVTTGGASVGDHDLVRPALLAAGGSLDFWRIALRPGKPMMAGGLGDAVVLGLPGNPVSAFMTATLFLKPLIAALSGAADPLPPTRSAILGEPLKANDHRTDYLRAATRDGRVFAAAIQDSSMLRTLARADCLIVREPHAPAAAPGDEIEILPIA
ncbi:MAG: molybdopterin molybdenumtransferase MoeA [Sphingomonas bacterium]|uniref:molybdopterin molybdotransferase MoeA n=1 Tax=Sphingomonas bacterium TaxID=1895847 RepID=UPI00261E8265|nr:molybdopterin molybdotransferase MoeA [Sphingomonas bacterium]MDB5710062.1 molybdopterin molybdenumtransferase MoeA [Sphingomonas bacterium]